MLITVFLNSFSSTQMGIHYQAILSLFLLSSFSYCWRILFHIVSSLRNSPTLPDKIPSHSHLIILPSLLHQQFPSFHWIMPYNLQTTPSTYL